MTDGMANHRAVLNPVWEKKLVVGPFQCNCRILACPETGEAAVIDAGDEAPRILEALEKMVTPQGQKVRVKYLLHTHGHLDHIAGTRGVKESLLAQAARTESLPGERTASIALHRGDHDLYLALREQSALFGLNYSNPLPVDEWLEHEQELTLGRLKLSVVHTPGHSPGSVCLRLHEDSGLQVSETLYSGDTLFQGSVGRTDLWGADGPLMFRMIRERILTLDGDTRVCPGHGPDTQVGIEKRSNPFLV